MPTTPNRGWPYPAYEENPYYTTIVSTFEAMDTDVHTLRSRLAYMWSGTTTSSAITATSLTAFDVSHTLPAGVLNTVGAVIRVRAGGQVTTTGAGTLLLGVNIPPAYIGGAGAVSYTAVTDQYWLLEATATIRASNTIYPWPTYVDMAELFPHGYPRQISYTASLSTALTVSVHVQWPTTGQSITLSDFLIEVLHPGP